MFLIISSNAFIKAVGAFHVCPVLNDYPDGPLHIRITGQNGIAGTAICEQLKLIDPEARVCMKLDRIPYHSIMDISDAVQGIFDYD
ncbi:MAG: type II toxin-antitoxin system PemK/MazF family toxin [Lachnospiraceae bacterium]|nr:type II toxin-antitoxin system PemK/MazF family toxin [Lachnospiraceae bacterium]